MKRRLTIDLPEKRWQELESYAEEDGQSLSEKIRWLLWDYAPPSEIEDDQ